MSHFSVGGNVGEEERRGREEDGEVKIGEKDENRSPYILQPLSRATEYTPITNTNTSGPENVPCCTWPSAQDIIQGLSFP
ncbi:hypothetical protein E2C01_032062 [Portunus trituberculatus]|uniref:Uncharacterized protein n=1 Tax=Portunus trituberculatus TaxID=210409 RepID=A0A5B7F0C1_PORTR|nr:hypothetical protein [Portunus trituberculatus]